jgi:hypothetical protein
MVGWRRHAELRQPPDDGKRQPVHDRQGNKPRILTRRNFRTPNNVYLRLGIVLGGDSNRKETEGGNEDKRKPYNELRKAHMNPLFIVVTEMKVIGIVPIMILTSVNFLLS